MVIAKNQNRYKYSQKGDLKKQEMDLTTKNSTKKRSFFGKAVSLAFVVAVIGTVIIIYIHQFVQISTTNYEVNRLKKEIAAMQEENDVIRLQIAQSKNLKRIEQQAREKLGMIEPGVKDTYYMSVQKNTTVNEAVSLSSEEDQKDFFVRDMMAWLKNLTSVEAGTLDE